MSLRIDRTYIAQYAETPTDINEHLLYLYDLVLELSAKNILEIGVARGHSTRAFLAALQETEGHLYSVDQREPTAFPNADFAGLCAERWTFVKTPSLAFRPACDYDLIFLDSGHTLELTRCEIEAYIDRTRVMVFHDTHPELRWVGPDFLDQIQVLSAVEEYIVANPGAWNVEFRAFNNGLAVLTRQDLTRQDLILRDGS